MVLVARLKAALAGYSIELLIVDDGSKDKTLERIRSLHSDDIRIFTHAKNRGKGAAIQTAIPHALGEVVVIQDSDLEYDPNDIPRLVQPILDGTADVVFGSRFHQASPLVHRFWHRVANGLLTVFSNMLTNLNLSDMETCYKAMHRDVIRQVTIHERRFGFEPELTAKIAKLKCRVYEIPISYDPRSYAAGKNIGWRDALRALWCIVRYRIAD